MAEAMAYNGNCFGMVGGILSVQRLPESSKRYIRFFHDNFRLFRDTDSAADVAVLHSFGTLAFNNDRPYQSTWLFEQALIQAQIPFDVIFDQHLKDLSRYRVLVLGDQECLSDAQLALIRAYVKNGGGLVATELTSLYTEWRELRRSLGLGDLFNVNSPAIFDNGIDVLLADGAQPLAPGPVRNQVGSGRVVYVPQVKPSLQKPPFVPMTSHYWRLPLNWQELVEAARWAAGGELALEVKAPLTVTTNLLVQKPSGTLLVHLVNYDVERTPKVENVEVSLRGALVKNVKGISLFSPDHDGVESLPPATQNGRLGFVVPTLNTYCVVEIQQG
jgi:hypothetical protein